MAVRKRPAGKRIPIPPLKPEASNLYQAAHCGLTLLFEERGGFPTTLSAQRLAVMVNARLKRVPEYEHAEVTRHVIEGVSDDSAADDNAAIKRGKKRQRV
jgi:hypothetical protein